MDIKYNKKKKKMRSDPLLNFMSSAQEFYTKNKTTFIGVIVVLAVVVLGGFGYRFTRQQTIDSAQDTFGKAMVAFQADRTDEAANGFTEVLDSYANTPQAAYSALMLGRIYMEQKNYDQAAGYFEQASQIKRNTGFVDGEALVALAAAYEAQGNTQRAVEYYQQALNQPDIGFRYPSIRWKMALAYQELGNIDQSRQALQQIVSDTTAGEYEKKAKNLLAELSVM